MSSDRATVNVTMAKRGLPQFNMIFGTVVILIFIT